MTFVDHEFTVTVPSYTTKKLIRLNSFFQSSAVDQKDNLEIRSAFEKVFILIKFLFKKNEGTHARRNLDGSSATTREATATCFHKRMGYRKSW